MGCCDAIRYVLCITVMLLGLDDLCLLAARPAFSPRYRFAEIRYLRAESRDKPARVETVVLFLPDVWRCAPTRLDWMNLQKAYTQKLQKKLNPDAEEPEEPQALIHSQRFFVDNLCTAMQPCCSSRVLLFSQRHKWDHHLVTFLEADVKNNAHDKSKWDFFLCL